MDNDTIKKSTMTDSMSGTFVKTRMATGTCSELDELTQQYRDAGDDFGKLLILIGRYRIDTGPDTPDSVEKARQLIATYIASGQRTREEKQRALDLRKKSLKEKLRVLTSVQERCGKYFERTMRELPNLSTFMTCQLYRICPDFKEQLKMRSEKLKNGRLRILVTGAVTSGKSSISSLLMGGAYLPVDHGPCTRIPCEITHSDERKAYLHYKEDNGLDPVVVELSQDENHPSWCRVRDCIEMGKDGQSGTLKQLEKVELMWPIVVLDNDAIDVRRITFIDVPGIYDTNETFLSLYPYIRSADAFLIIINNADDPGTANDRLLRLMRIIQEISEEDDGTFNPKFSQFVCNKWDRVDLGSRDKLMHTALRDLKTVWPGLSLRQLVPCSATREVLQTVKTGYIEEQFEGFLHKICSFIETAIRTQVEINSWWLSSFLDRTIVIIRHVDEVKYFAQQKISEVKKQIVTIKSNIVDFEETRKSMEQEILIQTNVVKQKVAKQIAASLDKKRKSLIEWTPLETPQSRPEDVWGQINHDICIAIAERLEQHIKSDKVVQAIQQEFDEFIRNRLLTLLRKYERLEKEMPLIVDITYGMETKFEGINVAIREQRSLFPYVAAGLALVFFPLAPFILILWRIYDEMYSPQLLCSEDEFIKDKTAYMKKQTEKFIDNIIQSRLVTVTEATVQDAPRNASFTIAFLHNCTEKHLESVDSLIAEVTSKGPRGDSPEKLESLSEELKLFVINNVLENDIDENSLEVDTKNPLSKIGEGMLTSVHRGKLITDDDRLDIAVKIIKWPRGDGNHPDNAFIIRELLTLQMLSHKPHRERSNFIQYHGFLTETTIDVFRLMLVTDLYQYNLKEFLEKDNLVLPSSLEKPYPSNDKSKSISWGYIFYIALQATRGLQFLHRYNVVHRDIKPSNFLIRFTVDDIFVYLADVGVSQRANLVNSHGPFLGTDIYNAPEVRHGGYHSPASDVYSLCLVLWELWHGKLVYAEHSIAQLRHRDRKPPKFSGISPPSRLKTLIQSGFDIEPRKRPNVREYVACLECLCGQYKWLSNSEARY